jgi:hypothetical protein
LDALVTAAMLNVCCVPGQKLAGPVTVPGVAEIDFLATVNVLAVLVPKQLLDFTEILPVVKAVWKLNVAEVVP